MVLQKDYKTTPKMGGRPINKGIENGVVSSRDYTKDYTTGYTINSYPSLKLFLQGFDFGNCIIVRGMGMRGGVES